MKTRHWRGLFHLTVLAVCAATLWPPFARDGRPGTLRLGLDLVGGTHLVLQVVPDGGTSGTPPGLLGEVIRILERRVNQLGVAEPVITAYGRAGDQVLVQLPGVRDVAQAKRLLVSVAQLSLRLVEDAASTPEALLDRTGGRPPAGLEILSGAAGTDGGTAYYLVHDAIVTGRDLRTARAGTGELGQPNVQFALTREAGARFERETRRNIGRHLAIVLDDRVTSAPVIEEAVGGEGQIRGRFTTAEADELAKVLRAGALPAKLRYLHELTIGPSLGADSIRAGLVASAAGMFLLTAFMLARYRWSGLNAVVALGANLLLLLAAMATSGATLSLPGIAGIVLTVGVGVDTNVLVFERIREELRAGKDARAAVRNGFDRVFVTILDTHATALIAATFLFHFGSGPIKGFATTLVMGLLANVFASYFVSRHLFEWALGRWRVERLSI